MELKIEYLNVNDLEEYSGNARKHQAIDIEAIMKSIKEFGFSDPIGIWSDHNVIVEGHGRLEAAKRLVLRELIDNAVAETLKERRKQIPKYSYPLNIVTSQMVSQYSKYGIDFEVSVEESIPISQLDSQKESGKSIYGKGYIINSKKKAEREKAEREKVERWELSKRELDLIKSLDENATILELKE